MVLLQINTILNSGSTGHIAEDIGKLAMSRGWTSYIAASRCTQSSTSNVIKIGNKFDCILHALLTRVFDLHGMGSYFATKKFLKRLDVIKPDLIQLHNIHGYYLYYPLLFKWIKDNEIPVVWTLHDCWSFTGHCAYYSYSRCQKWLKNCNKCKNKRSYPKSLLFSNSHFNYMLKKKYFKLHNNVTLVTPSTWLSNEVNKSFLNERKCYVINNGIDLDIFYPKNIETIEKNIILGVASVWENRKGFYDFIKLSNIISDNEVIVLIGVSEKQKRSLPKNIIGISRTESQNELAEWYSKAIVFVNPTYEDNFPTTNLEALACGTPVITYDTDGSPEIIDSETGIIISKGDIKGIFEGIKYIENKGKKKFSDKCRKRAERLYDKKNSFVKYINLYETILNQ